MRRMALSSFLAAAIAAVLVLVWANSTSTAAGLKSAMHRNGLTAANIAYGRAGGKPEFISINAPDGIVRPFYSLSKPMTAAAAIRLLDLDQDVAGATVRQILQHTGGWDRAIAGDPVTQRGQTEDCTDLPVPARQFEPGSRYAYSNIGYCLIGRAIEDKTGKPYQESVIALFPEARSMQYDPRLGPAGGWSGTAEDYFRFASRKVPAGTASAPIARPNDIPYGLGWAVGPDFVTHFGALRSNFSLVVKQGDFVAVGIFDGRPRDDSAAAQELRTALLKLKEHI